MDITTSRHPTMNTALREGGEVRCPSRQLLFEIPRGVGMRAETAKLGFWGDAYASGEDITNGPTQLPALEAKIHILQ